MRCIAIVKNYKGKILILLLLCALCFSACSLTKDDKFHVTFETNTTQTIAGKSAERYGMITLPTPEPLTGFNFGGWYLSEDYSGDRYDGGSSFIVSEDCKFYAKWQVAQFEDVIVYNGGKEIYRMEFALGSVLTPDDITPSKNLPYGEYSNFYFDTNHSRRLVSHVFEGELILYAQIQYYQVQSCVIDTHPEYAYFDSFSLSNLSLTIDYLKNGDLISYTYDYNTAPELFNFTPPPDNIGYDAPYDINLKIGNKNIALQSFVKTKIKPQSIEIVVELGKTLNFYYEFVDLSGISIIAHYNNGTSKPLEIGEYTVKSPTFTQSGEYDVVYTYISEGTTVIGKLKINLYDSTPVDNFNTVLQDGVYAITGFKDNNADVVVVPSEINGVRVGKIAPNAFKDKQSIKYVKIPDTVNFIGSGAFANCSYLKYVMGMPAVTEILASTFEACVELETVEFFSKVKAVGDKSFYKCMRLVAGIYGINEIGELAFAECGKLSEVLIPANTQLARDAFKGSHIENLTLESQVLGELLSVNTEAEAALDGAVITTVRLNATASGWDFLLNKQIPKWAIYGDTVSAEKFRDYKGIRELTVTSNGISFEADCFNGCSNLNKLLFLNTSSAVFKSGSFANTGIVDLKVDISVTIHGDSFLGSQLSSLSLKYASIHSGAFSKVAGLQTVSIGTLSGDLGASAFSECVKLTTFKVDSFSGKIGDFAFKDCVLLTSEQVALSGASFIGEGAFQNCVKINVLELNNVTSILDNAFLGSGLKRLHFGENLKTLSGSALAGSALQEIQFDKNNIFSVSVDGIVIEKLGLSYNLVKVLASYASNELIIYNDCRAIYSNAFESAGALRNVLLAAYELPSLGEKLIGDTESGAGIKFLVNPLSLDKYIEAMPGYDVSKINEKDRVVYVFYYGYRDEYITVIKYYGETVNAPEISDADKPYFDGWLLGGEPVTFPMTAKEHALFEAKTLGDVIKVTFESLEADYLSKTDMMITKDEIDKGKLYGELPTAMRSGYAFEFWYVDVNSDVKYDSGDIIINSNSQVLNYPHTVRPQWQKTVSLSMQQYNNDWKPYVTIDLSRGMDIVLNINENTKYMEIFAGGSTYNFKVVANFNASFVLYIKDLNLTGRNCFDFSKAISATVFYSGWNTLTGSEGTLVSPDGRSAMVASNLTLNGTGTFSVHGGNGAYGTVTKAAGGTGMVISGSLRTLGSGQIRIYGGDGGQGAIGDFLGDGSSSSTDGKNGGAGYDGGDGGHGLYAAGAAIIFNSRVEIRSGNGGNGGTGGRGGNGYSYDTSNYNNDSHKNGSSGGNGGAGGRGGNGGKSGIAIECSSLTYNTNMFRFIEAKSGDGGRGGDGGNGGSGQGGTNGHSGMGTTTNGRNGGNGGNGNIGGNGGDTYDGRSAILCGSVLGGQNVLGFMNVKGSVGTVAFGGNGGDYGRAGTGWFWGGNGKNGLAGHSTYTIEGGVWYFYNIQSSEGKVLVS